MKNIRPRETVILAGNFSELVAWYRDVLGFEEITRHEQGFHYCHLRTASGIRVGIASAAEMGVSPGDRQQNTVVLQFEVDDLPAFFDHLQQAGATITGPPAFNQKDGFWFGSASDPEGNPLWFVDRNCP